MRHSLRPFISTPFFAIVGRSGGMIIPFFIAHFYGAGPETDAFFFAFSIVLFLTMLFQQIFEAVLLPYLAEQKKNGADAVSTFVRKILYTVLPLLTVLAAAFSHFLPGLLTKTSGLGAQSSALTGELFSVMLPFLVLAVFVSALNSIYNLQRVFWYPAFSPFIRSVLVIVFIVLFHRLWGIHAISAGFAIGEVVRWLCSLSLLWAMGFWDFRSKGVKDSQKNEIKGFWSQAGFQVMALGAVQFIPLMNQWFASWLSSGDLSLLNYGERLYLVPYQVFLTGISQIFLSHWSDSYHNEEGAVFKARTARDIRITLWGAFAISLFCWFLRFPLVKLFFGYGRVTSEELFSISEVFGWFILGFAPAVITTLYLRVLFVLRKSNIFFIQSVFRLLGQVLFNYVFIHYFGVAGIAVATLLTGVLSAIALKAFLATEWREKKSVSE